MNRKILIALAAAALVTATSQASAQSGFALKGHYIVNESHARDARDARQVPRADGIGLGAELLLPGGLGIGVSGYTAGEASTVDYTTTRLTVLGEANYFVRLPLLPLSGYAGVHAGLGVLDRDNVRDPELGFRDRRRSQLGYQLGLRLQPTALLGIDAQWRRVSTSASEEQGGRLERNQVLVGVTLF